MKHKKIIGFIIFIMMIVGISFLKIPNFSIADSGFDVDYDSGGGFDYDFGSDYDFDSGSSGGSSSLGSFCCSSIIFITILAIIISSNHTNNHKMNHVVKTRKTSIPEEEIKKYLPEFEKNEFFNEAFAIYKDTQNAWMNFELEKVRSVLTDELYNMYSTQLDTLKVKGQQNIMKDFKLTNARVIGFNVVNNTAEIVTSMTIEFYDYIIDSASHNVLRGNKNSKVCVEYEMTFIKSMTRKESMIECPNCGAKVDVNSSNVCSYCNSAIVEDSAKWVLAKKRNIAQR
ncbi:MAG: Tim44 domain-containing protein [Clostridia bacterium]|nr:Tim44 domain-containing protein [Clostridia bacterium]